MFYTVDYQQFFHIQNDMNAGNNEIILQVFILYLYHQISAKFIIFYHSKNKFQILKEDRWQFYIYTEYHIHGHK